MRIDAVGDPDPSVTVGAMYSSGAQITSTGNVRVTSCHGRIAVNTAGSSGGVNLGSVNGTAQVSTGAPVESAGLCCLQQKHKHVLSATFRRRKRELGVQKLKDLMSGIIPKGVTSLFCFLQHQAKAALRFTWTCWKRAPAATSGASRDDMFMVHPVAVSCSPVSAGGLSDCTRQEDSA